MIGVDEAALGALDDLGGERCRRSGPGAGPPRTRCRTSWARRYRAVPAGHRQRSPAQRRPQRWHTRTDVAFLHWRSERGQPARARGREGWPRGGAQGGGGPARDARRGAEPPRPVPGADRLAGRVRRARRPGHRARRLLVAGQPDPAPGPLGPLDRRPVRPGEPAGRAEPVLHRAAVRGRRRGPAPDEGLAVAAAGLPGAGRPEPAGRGAATGPRLATRRTGPGRSRSPSWW